MRLVHCLVLFSSLAVCVGLHAADTADGMIIKQEACPVLEQAYEEYVQNARVSYEQERQAAVGVGVSMPSVETWLKTLPDRTTYERRMAHQGYECAKITYLSDGLKVTGYIFKPVTSMGKRLPVIISNRGGNGDFSKVVPSRVFLRDYEFLAQGFVIIASQYRGVDGGEGKDEFGGSDLHDVLALIPLARSLDYVDSANIFMYGFSRGGMMTYMALKNQVPVNAAAVSGGSTDLASEGQLRPEMLKVYEERIPGYKIDPANTMRERSAIDWPDKINTPLLLLHGTDDWRVRTEEALQFAIKLQHLHKTYALEIFSDDAHGLPLHNEEFHHRIVEWFRRYMK